MSMNWIVLIIAGLFEVGFTTCLGKAKETAGTTATIWGVGFFVCLTLSMWLLYKATQSIPMGTAYAVWTGIGAVGTIIIGILYFKEPATFWRLFFIVTLAKGIPSFFSLITLPLNCENARTGTKPPKSKIIRFMNLVLIISLSN